MDALNRIRTEPLTVAQCAEVLRLTRIWEAQAQRNLRSMLNAERLDALRAAREDTERAPLLRAQAEAYSRAIELLGTCWPPQGVDDSTELDDPSRAVA